MPAQSIAISSTLSPQVIGALGDEVVGSVVFEVTAASSLSTIVSVQVEGSGSTPTNCQYINMATGAVSAAGTAITANGVYGVYSPGCAVTLTTSAGTATVFVQRLFGRVL